MKGGGGKAGKVSPPSPDTKSPGRSRLDSLEAVVFSFKNEISSMLSNLTGRLTASHPPVSNIDGPYGTTHSGKFSTRLPSEAVLEPVDRLIVRRSN